jgi:hypothetical protein
MPELKVIISGTEIVGQTTKEGKELDNVMKQITGNPTQFVAHLPGGHVIATNGARTFETVNKSDMTNAYKNQ